MTFWDVDNITSVISPPSPIELSQNSKSNETTPSTDFGYAILKQ